MSTLDGHPHVCQFDWAAREDRLPDIDELLDESRTAGHDLIPVLSGTTIEQL